MPAPGLTRYLEPVVRQDLLRKMVFLAGPRQVGKTTLARRILETPPARSKRSASPASVYLNWDNRDDRREIRAARWPAGRALVVLDEIHKWRSWKSWIKGEYDKHRDHLRFLVTGSARLDIYRRGGDSLQGRYHHYRLHPFTCGEVLGEAAAPAPGKPLRIEAPTAAETKAAREAVAALMEFGGFPEPFVSQSARTLRRWQKDRVERLLREEIRELEAIRDLSSMQLLADMLPQRVASPLSLNAIREDLEVSHRALTLWMDVLERFYYVFRVPPYTSARVRSLRKMPKAYLWDASAVPDRGARFENLIALHLLKLCHYLQDREGYAVELCYLRDRTGRETDFLATFNGRPWFAVEAKLSGSAVDPSVVYFKERLKIPTAFQVTLDGERDTIERGVRVLPAHALLAALI